MNSSRALFLLALLALAFFFPLLLHPDHVLYSDHSDLLAMHLPMKRFLVRSWHETSELPLWCPHSFSGMPFIHDVQLAAFYPPHAILYFLPETRVGMAMSWLVVLHVVLAGWCMWAYARSFGLQPVAAFVAAVGYMFAGKWLFHVLTGGHYIMIPLAWLPLALLFLEQAVRLQSIVRALAAGAVYAMIVLGTHPQMTLYAGLFLAIWTLRPVVEAANRKQIVLTWLGMGVVAAATACLLSAVQLLPALEAAGQSSRSVGVHLRDILAASLPTLGGLIGPGVPASWEERGGLAVLWLTAAIMASILLGRAMRFPAIVSLVLLGFGVGGAVLVQMLPGFRLFQIPGRSLILLAFPMSLLVGYTTQALTSAASLDVVERSRMRRLFVALASVGLTLATVAIVGHYKETQGWPTWRDAMYWLWLLALVPLVWRMLAGAGQLRPSIWVGILVLDQMLLAWPQVQVRSERDIYPESEAIRWLAQRQAEDVALGRVLNRGIPGAPSSSPLGPALPMFGDVRLQPVLGYNTFDILRYKQYLQFVLDLDEPVRPREGVFGFPISDVFPLRNKALLDLLGVRFLLQPQDLQLPFDDPGGPESGDWNPVLTQGPTQAYSFLAGGMQTLPPCVLYENRSAFPKAFLVSKSERLAEGSELLPQLRRTNFRGTVLLEDAKRELEGEVDQDSRFQSFPLNSYQPNQITLRARTSIGGYLVLNEIWFPGWTCTVNGEPAPILRANYLFRAVLLPPGNFDIVFQFAPRSYTLGKQLSLGSLAGLFLIFGSAWIARRVHGHRLPIQTAGLPGDRPAPR